VEDAVIEMGKYLGVKDRDRDKNNWVVGWAWMSMTTVSNLDGVKNAMRIAYSTPQWQGGPTVVERVADKVFAVGLPSVLSPWFASL